ncbi:MAG: glycosyltransferase [Candidatus Woesearchaeota archaeon]
MLSELIARLGEESITFFQWYLLNGRIVLDYVHNLFNSTFRVFLVITVLFTSIYLFMSLFILFKRKKINEKEYNIKDAPFVSVQIPTRNELIALRCAEKCLEFDYPKEKFEILIGDDSDDSSVSEELMKFAEIHDNVKVIKREKNTGFKPGNLNNMLEYSKGEILVLFDSDFTPDKDFLRRIVAPFMDNPDVSAVQSRWNFNNFDQNLVTVIAANIVYVFHHVVLSFMNRFDSGSLCGSAEAIRKKDLIELGKWKSGSLTEDVEFSLRIHKSNKKIVYLPDLECNSDVPFKAKDLYKQQMRWAYGVIGSYQEHLPSILTKRSISINKKMLSMCAGFGYLLPLLILFLFFFGLTSFVTDRPAPIDLVKFLSETGINILLTSGMIIASVFALYQAKKSKYVLRMILGSFTIGLVTTYYVNKGIIKSIFKKPMDWYLLNKSVYKQSP